MILAAGNFAVAVVMRRPIPNVLLLNCSIFDDS